MEFVGEADSKCKCTKCNAPADYDGWCAMCLDEEYCDKNYVSPMEKFIHRVKNYFKGE